ncbi:uncharacterized protein LOC131221028 [Magnolia sinica]|uniref:uncharacterized protein LOC131221028 n=1 Tax=Magnolia sinica TaxID=86752 RepID=UPI00265860D1|nr:uncharacterized protein LOC131221028 [Magnolia sinica]XP_058072099.1 uncharacterized protein LOC131221028 [Magnolia sinica]
MDNSIMGGSLLSGPSAGILDLDPSFHRNPPQHYLSRQVPVMGMTTGLETDHTIPLKGTSVNCGKGKGISSVAAAANHNSTSDEDELGFREDGSDVNLNGAKGKKGSPWQRMKWTDDIVRMLITAVLCVGVDGTTPDGPADGPHKRKSRALQKKGKWKNVSKIMMERGCYVSPQQCEDKFNDLNKRYKRLNEILGCGTTCRVVENPSLLDSMSHLSAKMKEDVRKILSSKHLFYREMCAYHTGQRICDTHEIESQGYPMAHLLRCSRDSDQFEGEDDEDDEDCDGGTENEDDANGDDEDDERNIGFGGKKTNIKEGSFWSLSNDNYAAELIGLIPDATKLPWDQLEWIRNRTLQLHEQRVSVQAQVFELEQHRFKWEKFCRKKDKELDRLRLENECMRLENEQIALQVKQKEMEIDFRRSGAVTLDKLQGRDPNDLGRVQ